MTKIWNFHSCLGYLTRGIPHQPSLRRSNMIHIQKLVFSIQMTADCLIVRMIMIVTVETMRSYSTGGISLRRGQRCSSLSSALQNPSEPLVSEHLPQASICLVIMTFLIWGRWPQVHMKMLQWKQPALYLLNVGPQTR